MDYFIKVSKVDGKYQVNTKVPPQVLYAWKVSSYLINGTPSEITSNIYYLSVDVPPETSTLNQVKVAFVSPVDNSIIEETLDDIDNIAPKFTTSVISVGNNFSYETNFGEITFERVEAKDFKLWEGNRFSETLDYSDRFANIENDVAELKDKINIVKLNFFRIKDSSGNICSNGVFANGESLENCVLEWDYSEQNATKLQVLRVNNNSISIPADVRSYTFDSLTETSTFTLEFKDVNNNIGSSGDISVFFKGKVYWGAGTKVEDGASYSSEFVSELSNQKLVDNTSGEYEFNLDSDEKYGFFAYPADWGEIKSWVICDFEVDTVDCGTVEIDNIEYKLLRTTQPGLGEFNIELKDAKNNTGVQQ